MCLEGKKIKNQPSVPEKALQQLKDSIKIKNASGGEVFFVSFLDTKDSNQLYKIIVMLIKEEPFLMQKSNHGLVF